jgi:SAM-dependent methyltransferase
MNLARRLVGKAVRTVRYCRHAVRFQVGWRKRLTPHRPPHQLFHKIGDDYWLWLHTAGRRASGRLRRILPDLPSPELQANFTGSSGDTTLREGHAAYVLFKRLYEKHAGPLSGAHAVLDFGCGWGRIQRFFLKEIPSERLWGADQCAEVIDVCRQTNRWCRFVVVPPRPPFDLPENDFDLIYCYSVFSHLPEDLQFELLREFRRLLRPGGLLLATTRDRQFIHDCEALRRRPDLALLPTWLRASAPAFKPAKDWLARYDAGEYCYHNFGHAGQWSFWGEACIPPSYVRRHWTEHFEFLDYIQDRRVTTQNVIVARKRGTARRQSPFVDCRSPRI